MSTPENSAYLSCVVIQPLCLSPSHNKPPGLAKIATISAKANFFGHWDRLHWPWIFPRLGTFENKSTTFRRLFRNWRIDWYGYMYVQGPSNIIKFYDVRRTLKNATDPNIIKPGSRKKFTTPWSWFMYKRHDPAHCTDVARVHMYSWT